MQIRPASTWLWDHLGRIAAQAKMDTCPILLGVVHAWQREGRALVQIFELPRVQQLPFRPLFRLGTVADLLTTMFLVAIATNPPTHRRPDLCNIAQCRVANTLADRRRFRTLA